MINAPDKTYTLSDFISMKDSDNITYHNFAILSQSLTNENIQYSIDNIIYDYLDELKSLAQPVTLSETEFIKYQYKPKILAYDLYGSVETYFILLAINGMCSVKEFSTKNIKAIRPDDLAEVLSKIYNAESNYISYNRNNLNIVES